jgi:AraC family transcriptional activator of pobA
MKNIAIRHINAPHKEPALSEGFRIRDVRALLGGNDMIQDLHRHDFFFVLALNKAMGSHEIDFTPYKVGNESIFFMRPGQVHQLTLKAKSTGYLMEFKTDFYFPQDNVSNELLRNVSNKSICKLDPIRFKKSLTILTSIFDEFTNKKEKYQEAIKANLNIFFIELIRQGQKTKRSPDKKINYAQKRLEEFLHLLETHVSVHKQVSEYAKMLNLSLYQLNAVTKTTLGKTGSEVIDEHVILEAKRHLLATSNQISQIAYHLGYEDVSYFIRFFKKHTGHSPEAFRNNFR